MGRKIDRNPQLEPKQGVRQQLRHSEDQRSKFWEAYATGTVWKKDLFASWKDAEFCGEFVLFFFVFCVCSPSPLKHMHESIRAGLQFSSLGLHSS